jgi:hypothetical protein
MLFQVFMPASLVPRRSGRSAGGAAQACLSIVAHVGASSGHRAAGRPRRAGR